MEPKKYFQHYESYFWTRNFYLDGENTYVYETKERSTIAYSDFVVSILDALSVSSVPPLGSLLLTIAATNLEPDAILNEIKRKAKSVKLENPNPNFNLYGVDAAFDFLEILVKLPAQYKTGSKRIHLLQTIFEECHNRISGEKFKRLLQEYKLQEHELLGSIEEIPFNNANFVKDFRTVGLLKLKFPTVQSIISAMENLPDTNEIAENLDEQLINQEAVSDKPMDFVDQLIDNNKTFHVGVLIKRIWSGIKIPLHHNQPSDQPLGGIADITNKGDFSRLLLSEFANDDLVFMSRIANNEALYIEREIPPQDDKFVRDILIDSTLRNWGNPKIVSFAAALAIAKHPKAEVESTIFVLGDGCEKITYESVHEVIDGLELISPDMTCASGLHEYFQQSELDAREKETYLIMAEENLKSEQFQKTLHENYDRLHFIFTTNDKGEISFYKVANKGRKLIQKMTLPLEELWKEKRDRLASRGKSPDQSDAVIPLLYPLERNYNAIFHCEGAFYSYYKGRLYAFSDGRFNKGFIKMASGIPFHDGSYCMMINQKKQPVLVNFSSSTLKLNGFNIETGETFPCSMVIDFTEYDYLFYHDKKVYLKSQSKRYFCQINSDGSWKKIDTNPDLEKALSGYTAVKRNFIQDYGSDTNKYDIVRKNESSYVTTFNNSIEFNDYYLFGDRFRKSHFYHDIHALTPMCSLILKRNHPTSNLNTSIILKEALKISIVDARLLTDSHLPVLLENVEYEYADRIKAQIEATEAVCYIEINYFKSDDGSIITNKDGILEFESSDKNIPKFYITFILKQKIAMATDYEFAGNEYFLPRQNSLTVISVESFYEKYINPFIKNIRDNGIPAQTD